MSKVTKIGVEGVQELASHEAQGHEGSGAATQQQPDRRGGGSPQHDRRGFDTMLATVTVSMAILSVFIAATSLLGHRTHTEELGALTQTADTWSYFQAKNLRHHTYALFADLLGVTQLKDPAAGRKLEGEYRAKSTRYETEMNEIETRAKDLSREAEHYHHRAMRFDLGEVLLEAALVLASLTVLTRKKAFWRVGMALALVGIGVVGSGFLL